MEKTNVTNNICKQKRSSGQSARLLNKFKKLFIFIWVYFTKLMWQVCCLLFPHLDASRPHEPNRMLDLRKLREEKD